MFFSFFVSCKKYGDGYISGTVYEKGSNAPVPNTEVSILRVYQKYDLQGSVQHQNTEIISSTLSDNDGYYKINFRKKVGSKYYIKCSNESFYSNEINENITNKKFNFDIYVNPFRYFRIRVVKNSTNILKRISIGLTLNQGASLQSLNTIDTILPKVYKAIGFSDNSIYHYICTLPPYTTSGYEECGGWIYDNLYLTTTDTIVKTYVID